MGLKRFLSHKFKRSSNLPPTDPDESNFYNGIESWDIYDPTREASISYSSFQPSMPPHNFYDSSTRSTIQDAENTLEKNPDSILSPYRQMDEKELEDEVTKEKRSIKINCLHKGKNLTDQNSLAFDDHKLSKSRMRMTVENSNALVEEEGTVRDDGMGGRNVIVTLLDGSQEASRAFEESTRMMTNPGLDHLILVVPWNSRLPKSVMKKSFKRVKHLSAKDCSILLQGFLWRSAKEIALRYEFMMRENYPSLDYTILIPGVKDPKELTAILASKYIADWIVIGESENGGKISKKRRSSVGQHFGSKGFVAELSKFTGTSKLMVV